MCDADFLRERAVALVFFVVAVDDGFRQVLRIILAQPLIKTCTEKDTNISLDGKVITNTIERVQRERGLSLVRGGMSCGF